MAKDYVQAADWYRVAAEHGNAKAQHALGHLYETGRGVKRNAELAKEWKSEAMKQNYEP